MDVNTYKEMPLSLHFHGLLTGGVKIKATLIATCHQALFYWHCTRICIAIVLQHYVGTCLADSHHSVRKNIA